MEVNRNPQSMASEESKDPSQPKSDELDLDDLISSEDQSSSLESVLSRSSSKNHNSQSRCVYKHCYVETC